MAWQQCIVRLTPRSRGFHLITHEIEQALGDMKKPKIGLLHLFLQHTSASLTINENADPTVRQDLEAYFMENGSYTYLLGLTDLQRLDTAIEERKKQLDAYRNELEELQAPDTYFKGARIWINEIEQLKQCIEEGLRLGWDYGAAKPKY